MRSFGLNHYRLGCVLLDLEDPSKVIGRALPYILGPTEHFERVGDVFNVVFSCGTTLDKDGQNLCIYYGGADSCLCLAHARLDDLVNLCLENSPSMRNTKIGDHDGTGICVPLVH